MSGEPRRSAEAVARNREQSRLRAAARRESRSEQEHETHLKERREYEAKNAEHINAARQTRYGNDHEMALASRPFIGWDGEGYRSFAVDPSGEIDELHHYMLFGNSRMPDEPITSRDLTTKECLDYMFRVESLFPDAFHVGFAFDYDVNMILVDLSSRHLKHLAEYGMCHWSGYRIAYIPSKMFRVSRGPKEARESITIFDTFGFFHCKYTTALIKFGVATDKELAHIMEGKDRRGSFTYRDMEYVKEYWQDEISFFPPLMDKVRDACYDNGYFINSWHGPGALATYVLRKRGVHKWKSDPEKTPAEVQIATQYAYAGGRFQTWRCGLYLRPIHTADLNSAYIYACSLLPRLDNGRWIRANRDHIDRNNIARFGLYRISFDDGPEREQDNRERGAFGEVYPLFCRDRHGGLCWPSRVDGWYWSPEAQLVADNPDARFLEAWIYDDDGTYPFRWVSEEFAKRLDLQHEGNPAEKTIKWMLAAMYGAFAQLVGWDKKKRTAPPKHELAWAGFITSWCRAEVWRVAYECWRRGGLVSIDTDGISSTVPFDEAWLDGGVGEGLGQWKLESFAGILGWQSGMYWLMDENGEWSTVKTRGIRKGSVDISVALDALAEADYTKSPQRQARFHKTQTRFIGFKQALNERSLERWRHWVKIPMTNVMGQSRMSKHVNVFCRKCRSPDADMMHVITNMQPDTYISQPHKLPWLEVQPMMPDTEMIIILDSDEADLL